MRDPIPNKIEPLSLRLGKLRDPRTFSHLPSKQHPRGTRAPAGPAETRGPFLLVYHRGQSLNFTPSPVGQPQSVASYPRLHA